MGGLARVGRGPQRAEKLVIQGGCHLRRGCEDGISDEPEYEFLKR